MRVRRGLAENGNCWLCRDEREDINHVLRRCPAADAIWSRLLPTFHSRTKDLPLKEWLDLGISTKGSQNRPENDNITFGLTSWWLWKWRNEVIFKNSFHPLNSKTALLKSQVEEVVTAFTKDKNFQHSIHSYKWTELKWDKPREGQVKINYDGAVNASRKAACGGLVRDCNGRWRGGFMYNIGSCTPLVAEAWALLKSIQLANYMGYKRVIFEGDSHELISMMNEGSAGNGIVCNIMSACRRELGQMDEWIISAIPREINTPADSLAGTAMSIPKGLQILMDPPDNILSLIDSDEASFPAWRLVYKSS